MIRNKKTGKIFHAYPVIRICDGATDICFNSLARLNEEFEDYKPKDPLIKDENIRKAVRAWAEANGIERVWHEYSSCWLRGNGLKIELENGIDDLEQNNYTIDLCGGIPDVIWASPDCTTYSVAAISHHRRKNGSTLEPISDYAKQCDETNRHVIELIKEIKPRYWFIENPRGGLRKMDFMAGLPRYTVTYCQYGERRMKPTDIWTNHPNPRFKPACHYGDACHEPAPRGSKTGTQGIKGHIDRSRIPDALADHIAEICMEDR